MAKERRTYSTTEANQTPAGTPETESGAPATKTGASGRAAEVTHNPQSTGTPADDSRRPEPGGPETDLGGKDQGASGRAAKPGVPDPTAGPDAPHKYPGNPDRAAEGSHNSNSSGPSTKSFLLEPVSPSELPQAQSLLQSRFWADHKREFGWRPYAFILYGKYPLLVLHRTFALGFSLAYVPWGLEEWKESDPREREKLLRRISQELYSYLPKGTLVIRYDLPWEVDPTLADAEQEELADEDEETDRDDQTRSGDDWEIKTQTKRLRSLLSENFYKALSDIQPPSTVILDLDAYEEEILMDMKQKTRYNIRLAGKKGVETKIYGAEEALGISHDGRDSHDTGNTDDTKKEEAPLSAWYRLYRETAERDGIAIHSEKYYRRLFSLAAEYHDENAARDSRETKSERSSHPELFLVTAEHEGDLLAGIIVSIYAGRATYMYGAGSNKKRKLMGSYAVQWEAIQHAKNLGASEYDMFGIPPSDDPSHPMHGLYRFKTGFGGNIIHRIGAWDYPISRTGYKMYRSLEKMRLYYYKNLKKR